MICAAAGAVLVGDAPDVADAAGWMHPESSIDRNLPVPNAVLTDLAAALGEVQLEQLDGFVERRTEIAREYQSIAAELGLEVKVPAAGTDATWWRFLVALPPGHDIDAVVDAARIRDVVFARPVTHPPSDEPGAFPVSERMRRTLVSIPIYPSLSDADVERVSGVLRSSVAESLAAHR
jgi:dTDP-4-amino-4,6-dideoxygalactose transaminase